MSGQWVRLENDFMEDDKFDGISPAAGWLWIAGLCYANYRLTDGKLVGKAVDRVKMASGRFNADTEIAELVERNLWETIDGGYQIVSYAKYQKTKDRYERDLEMGRQRYHNWYERNVRPPGPNSPNSGISNAATNGNPNPDPNAVRYRGNHIDPIDLDELRSRKTS